MEITKRAAELLKSGGLRGPQDLVFLMRYSYLADDSGTKKAIEKTMEEMKTMRATGMLAYAYSEWAEFSGAEYCGAAVEYILQKARVSDETRFAAYAKAAGVFNKREYLKTAEDIAGSIFSGTGDNLSASFETLVFGALGYAELYRSSLAPEYLISAISVAEYIYSNFRSLFNAGKCYDLEMPCANSAAAVLYDRLARITMADKWIRASETQNKMIRMLADKYPTMCSFGLCALLPAEFGSKTVVCSCSDDTVPEVVLSLRSMYSPYTNILLRTPSNSAALDEAVPAAASCICKGAPAFYLLSPAGPELIKI